MKRSTICILITTLLLTACTPQAGAEVIPTAIAALAPTATSTSTATLEPAPSLVPTFTPAAQPRLNRTALGPDADSFPEGVNPLTGRAVSNPDLLGLPAMLVSISNSPVSARPQAGPAFADWVFEMFIGYGTTRFLGVFYGEYPRPLPNVSGGCAARDEIFHPQGEWLGGRVWLDENGDSRLDDWEQGLGGICVSLLDSASGSALAKTSTDGNGYFAFDMAEITESVQIHFQKTDKFDFVTPNLGDDDTDSDADPATGLTESFDPVAESRTWSAGVTLKTPPAAEEGRVQPIRSGRLTYATINRMFPYSCLAFAGAGHDILPRLDKCKIVIGTDDDDVNDGILTASEMRALAEGRLSYRPINYSGHLFDPAPPPGGLDAEKLWVYFHQFNQAEWQYDPISGTYLRWNDFQDNSGVFTPALDALTGRQLAFENVVVIYATHDVFRHNQYDINLRPGLEGYAFAFRDGQMYQIRWSTANREWERQSGLLRPLHFIWPDKTEFPLKPGRTFIHIMTEFSAVSEQAPGDWRAFFVTPYDPAPEP
ncbi:MAG: DUF3048 C-terminal domain-containing protein [Anaerolineales bacterium]